MSSAGFHRVWRGSGQVFDAVDLHLPDFMFETQAAYLRVPRAGAPAPGMHAHCFDVSCPSCSSPVRVAQRPALFSKALHDARSQHGWSASPFNWSTVLACMLLAMRCSTRCHCS
eukprot:366380-Chlamydomonas_euryale.AAC.8